MKHVAFVLMVLAAAAVAAEKLSPFTEVEFEGETPFVKYEGKWYEQLELEGMKASKIVGFCRKTCGRTFKPGWIAVEALLYELESGALRGGFACEAESSPKAIGKVTGTRGTPGGPGLQAVNDDLRRNLKRAIVREWERRGPGLKLGIPAPDLEEPKWKPAKPGMQRNPCPASLYLHGHPLLEEQEVLRLVEQQPDPIRSDADDFSR